MDVFHRGSAPMFFRPTTHYYKVHKPSETPFFELSASRTPGRGGQSLDDRRVDDAASRGRSENGISSMIHSSITIAIEYMSECIITGTMPPSMSSVAEYLTTSPDDAVFDILFSVISSTIFAIQKSQIRGSPLPECGEPVVCGSSVNVEFTSGD